MELLLKTFSFTLNCSLIILSEANASCIVPGLSDDALLNVRRGRLRVTSAEIKTIFDPVIDEVVFLVKGQIRATKEPVKVVLLVGGFGQSAYLRDCVRGAVGSKVEVMQPPNG